MRGHRFVVQLCTRNGPAVDAASAALVEALRRLLNGVDGFDSSLFQSASRGDEPSTDRTAAGDVSVPTRPSSALFHALHSLVSSLGQLGPHRTEADLSIATELLAAFESSTASACVDLLTDVAIREPLGLQVVADVHYMRAIRGEHTERDVWSPVIQLVEPAVRSQPPDHH